MPRQNLYAQFAGAELILRDQLAIDRSVLANERTFLAYCRTSLALFITGAGAIKFLEGTLASVGGWGLIILGVVVAVIGSWRSLTTSRNIKTVYGQGGAPG